MDNKEQIRNLIANIYNVQKLRIAAGNRVVQNFYQRLGIKPGESPEDDKENQRLIQILKKEYKRITDGVIDSGKTPHSIISLLLKDKEPIQYISSDLDYNLVKSYMMLIESEDLQVKVLSKEVQKHPMWDKFFKDIKGCGPLMAGVCLAYLDPRKADHVSSFYRYCGLDTVQSKDKDGNYLYKAMDGSFRDLVMKVDGTDVHYYDCETGEEYYGNVQAKMHGRRKGDVEEFEYTDKNGNKSIKKGITYNPIIKTKLMGVLTGCFLKSKGEYADIYYDYKNKLEHGKRYEGLSAGQINMMAQRYMIKQFLRNLWVTWRTHEGLIVDFPYEVEKLGNRPHKYNDYQCRVAKQSNTFNS